MTYFIPMKYHNTAENEPCKEANTMEVKAQSSDPREHINEEPRNDLGDLMNGFFGMTTFMTVLFFGMVIVKFILSE